MEEPIIIAAGTPKRENRFKVPKPYLRMRTGKTIVGTIAEEALKLGRPVYVCGDKSRLSDALADLHDPNLSITPEGDSLVENVALAFFSYLRDHSEKLGFKPFEHEWDSLDEVLNNWGDLQKYIRENSGAEELGMFLVLGDIPLLNAETLKRIINQTPQDADMCWHFGEKSEFEEALHGMEPLDYERAKMFFFPMSVEDETGRPRQTYARFGNVIYGKPLKLELPWLELIQEFHDLRNYSPIKKALAIRKFTRDWPADIIEYRPGYKGVPHIDALKDTKRIRTEAIRMFLSLHRVTRRVPFGIIPGFLGGFDKREYIKQTAIERIASEAFGLRFYAPVEQLGIRHVLDVDTQYAIDYINRNDLLRSLR